MEQPGTREQHRAAYAAVTARDLWADAAAATTVDEIDQVAHLSLLLVGHLDAEETGLTKRIAKARARIAGPTREQLVGDATEAEMREATAAGRKARRKDLWSDREARIARLGINHATAARSGP